MTLKNLHFVFCLLYFGAVDHLLFKIRLLVQVQGKKPPLKKGF